MLTSRIVFDPERARCCVAGWLNGAAAATAALALVALPGSALAANANFEVKVESIPTTVSVSRPGLTTYAAFTVSIKNSSGNTNNNIRFGGSADVSGDLTATNGDAGAIASYVETIPKSACSPTTPGGTTVQCNFAQMKAGANNSFVVIFATPTLAAADHWADNAKINFSWTFDYASGNSSGTPSSLLCNGTQVTPPCAATNSTALVTTQSDAILEGFLTYIPSFGGTFFTGNGSSVLGPIGTNLRPTALTKLTVPTGQNLTTAQADVTVVLGGVTGDTTTTNTAIVGVPNGGQLFTSYAIVELRRDASTIAKGAKIENAAVSYSHDDAGTPAPLLACPSNGIPTTSAPVCLFSRTEFTKKNAPTPDDIGDWLFVVHALENGRFVY
jgi:hypothetical protein